MVTGGTDWELGSWLASAELLIDGEWEAGVDLPVAVQAHCMVQLNYSHVFYSGGWEADGNITKSSYIYSNEGGFQRLADMETSRAWHGCALKGGDVLRCSNCLLRLGKLDLTYQFLLGEARW